MLWSLSHRCDPFARDIADRHYNRQSIGAANFAPPGRCLVLTAATPTGKAFWITSWPYAKYVRHAWAGAWMCSAFRNEGAGVASELIVQALAATQAYYGEPPILGMVTFLDRSKVKPTCVRGKKVWGWTWLKAGFSEVGETEGGLLALQLRPDEFPTPSPARGADAHHRDFRPAGSLALDHLRPWMLAA